MKNFLQRKWIQLYQYYLNLGWLFRANLTLLFLVFIISSVIVGLRYFSEDSWLDSRIKQGQSLFSPALFDQLTAIKIQDQQFQKKSSGHWEWGKGLITIEKKGLDQLYEDLSSGFRCGPPLTRSDLQGLGATEFINRINKIEEQKEENKSSALEMEFYFGSTPEKHQMQKWVTSDINLQTGHFLLAQIISGHERSSVFNSTVSQNTQIHYFQCFSDTSFDGIYQNDIDLKVQSFEFFKRQTNHWYSWLVHRPWLSLRKLDSIDKIQISLGKKDQLIYDLKNKIFFPDPPKELGVSMARLSDFIRHWQLFTPLTVMEITSDLKDRIEQQSQQGLSWTFEGQGKKIKLFLMTMPVKKNEAHSLEDPSDQFWLWDPQLQLLLSLSNTDQEQLIKLTDSFWESALKAFINLSEPTTLTLLTQYPAGTKGRIKENQSAQKILSPKELKESFAPFFCLVTACHQSYYWIRAQVINPLMRDQYEKNALMSWKINEQTYYWLEQTPKWQLLTPGNLLLTYVVKEPIKEAMIKAFKSL